MSKERWNSRLGVILAVSGSAVGLGNFLRFPGQAAEYGGGAFMLAYFISFLIIGLPLCWAEWSMGRYAGQFGFHSCPGILTAVSRHPAAKYLGVLGLVIPVIIYMYYVYIEAWCLGYAVNFLAGNMQFSSPQESSAFWGSFIGIEKDGSALQFGFQQVGVYLILVFILNFILIYRGISRGIELFCKFAMPTLVVLAFVILIRVLTLGSPVEDHPERSVNNGLGFLWNPNKVFVEEAVTDPLTGTTKWVQKEELVGKSMLEAAALRAATDPGVRLQEVSAWTQLRNPQLWLAAAGQIFFSLSIGFGIIMTYSSYLSRKDDVVLSGLTATSANEFCEVALGGLITVPAAVAFLGVASVAGMGTFGLGFNVLPMVFSTMPAGDFFGFLFFFLLFLAAVTSSLSMLQPGIAFLETGMGINRRQSVAILGIITALGCAFVVYFSAGAKALDTLDFWVGTFLIFVLATVQIVIFSWVFGVERGFQVAHEGSLLRIPSFFKIIMKYICPAFLLLVFFMFILVNVFGYTFGAGESQVSYYVTDLSISDPNPVAWMSISLIVLVGLFFLLITSGVERYRKFIEEK